MNKMFFSGLLLSLITTTTFAQNTQTADEAANTQADSQPVAQTEQASSTATGETPQKSAAQNTNNNPQDTPDSDEQSADTAENSDNPPPQNPHPSDAPTLAELQKPTDSELSLANKELLAKNTELESQIASLTTQTNVLVNERTAQLYLYGALTAICSFLLGGFSVWFVLNRKKSGW